MEPVGLHKCKNPAIGRGLHPIWSRKEVLFFMRLLLLFVLLRILRTRRFRLRIEFDL
jgi:hypothetical protein